MALTVVAATRDDARLGSTLRTCIIQHNAFLNALRAQCVLLDADATITATNYASTLDASGVRLIGDARLGTEITA